MAQLVVAAAGAAIGGWLAPGVVALGMTGASIGWMAGSIVGARLFAPDAADGPRLSDKRVSSNVYGQPIPIPYGTIRVAGQTIWASELIESSEEVGGKGSSDGATIYHYSVNILTSVCEGPVEGVLRIWANGRLIWRNDGTADGEVDAEIVQPGAVRIYLGGEDQMPDPTYEAAVGSENAVAYRGQCVVAIDGMQLDPFGNRPPSLEFEVTTTLSAEEPELVRTVIAEYQGSESGESAARIGSELIATETWWVTAGGETNEVIFINRETLAQYVVEASDGPTHNFVVVGPYLFTVSPNLSLHRFDLRETPPTAVTRSAGYLTTQTVATDGTDIYTLRYGYNAMRRWDVESLSLKFESSLAGNPDSALVVIGTPPVAWYGIGKTLHRHDVETGANTSLVLPTTGAFSYSSKILHDPRRNSLLFLTDASDELVEVSIETMEIVQIITGVGGVVDNGGGALSYDDSTGLYVYATEADIYWINVAAGQVVDRWTAEHSPNGIREQGLVSDGAGGVYVSETDSTGWPTWLVHYTKGGGSTAGGPITLQEIVEDVCTRAGLPAGNLDASAGTDLVGGYKIGRPTSARAVIDQLRPGYFFDMVESGTEIVLRKRGAAAVATIDAGELGARTFQLTATDPEPAYEMEHVEEIEAPRELSLHFIDFAADYDPGVQTARRQATTSQAIATLEVPVVFDGGVEEASTVAWKNLIHAHASKNPVSLKLTHHYEALEAADAINVPLAGGDLQRLRIDQIERARPLLELRCFIEDMTLYDLAFEGAERGQGPRQGAEIAQVADTILALIDTSPLRDADDTTLLYAAVGRDARTEVWSGAGVYKSVDGGVSYASVLTTTAQATIGTTVGALDDWSGGNVWDDESTVDVLLTSGTFSSATDLGVLNGANALAIKSGSDWEIVQFVNAELVATDTWRLSRLLRGRRGTERAIPGHGAGDRVVLLTAASMNTIGATLAEVGAARQFRAATSGKSVADAAAQEITLAANTIRPLSPVSIAASRDAGDLTITWIRRARLNAEWVDNIDVPLDEPTESYEIDILDGTTVVRTLTATTTTAEYTAAQQTTDFGSPQAAVDVEIYQMSSRVGRGHAGEATV
jgi:hypothetical protein